MSLTIGEACCGTELKGTGGAHYDIAQSGEETAGVAPLRRVRTAKHPNHPGARHPPRF